MPKKTFIRTIVCVLLLCFYEPIYTQRISVERELFNEESGLSKYANYIHKDSRGILWIGTHFGLYRFDGHDFLHFDENTGLPFNRVMEIFEDSEGWFWLFNGCFRVPNCEKDLAFFHPLTKEVLTFQQRFGNATIQPSQIESIGQDASKIYLTAADRKLLIWSSEEGLKEVQIEGLTQTPFLWAKASEQILGAFIMDSEKGDPNYFDQNRAGIQYLAIDLNGRLVQAPSPAPILYHNILERMRRISFEFDRMRLNELEISLSENGALNIDTLANKVPSDNVHIPYYYFDQELCIDEGGQFLHLELGKLIDLSGTYPDDLFNNRTNRLKTTQVIWVKDQTTQGQSTCFRPLFVGTTARMVYFDKDAGTAWAPGVKGLYVMQFQPRYFNLTAEVHSNPLAYSMICLDDKHALLQTEPQFYIYDQTTGEADLLPAFDTGGTRKQFKAFTQEKNENHFWGISNTYLKKIEQNNLSLIEYKLPKDLEGGHALLKNGNQIWIGDNEKGLYIYDIEKNSFEVFDQFNEFKELKKSKVHFFKKYGQDKIWIATDSGLYLYAKEEGIIEQYSNTEKGNNYLPADQIYHLSDAKAGGYWLATENGLVHFLYKPKNGTNYSVPFSDTEIFAAYEDEYGFVWMPTPTGLIQFQINTKLFKTYFAETGGSQAAFQKYAHARSEDGTLYMGSYSGFHVFHPRDFKDVNFNPQVPLIITEYEQHVDTSDQIENRLKEIIENKEIVMQPGDKFFSLRVALEDYRNADKHRFAYRIEGYQKDWQEDKSNLIRVNGLPYGNYILQIKGRLPDGQFAGPILSIPVHVLKPFYLQTWFFITSIIALLLSIFLFYKWRTQRLVKRQKELESEVKKATQTIRQQNAELKNLDKVKSRFFANVSHELRTPLTLILGPLTSMLKSGKLNERNSTFAELGRKNAKGLLNLVNEILDLTKMESGKIELHEEVIDFYPFLQRIVGAYLGAAQQKEIKYEFDYAAEEDVQLSIDQKKFEKLFNNLLSNAFKFTPSKGNVSAELKDEGTHYILEVKDSGRGIHPDDLPHVFDRYFQSSQPDVPKEGGTGIGLSLSLEFAKLMGGQLWVESELGEGSIFYFRFPKKVAGTSADGQPVADGQQQPTDSGLSGVGEKTTIMAADENENAATEIWKKQGPFSVLLVEDNDNLRDYIQLIIGEKYKVETAENGKVAWELLTANGGRRTTDGGDQSLTVNPLPDLILSDIMMPEMDGYQLLTKLKGDDRFRGTPVIMLTALADLKDKLKALRIGVDDYMLKPFEEEELLARIDNLLRNSWERRIFYQKEVEVNLRQPSPEAGKKETKKEPPTSTLSNEDTDWLTELERVVAKEIPNFNFTVDQLARTMSMSKRSLELRVKSLTGLTPKKYIQEIRFNVARQLLENGEAKSVKALAYQIGLKDTSHFSKLYKQRFGRLPSEYLG